MLSLISSCSTIDSTSTNPPSSLQTSFSQRTGQKAITEEHFGLHGKTAGGLVTIVHNTSLCTVPSSHSRREPKGEVWPRRDACLVIRGWKRQAMKKKKERRLEKKEEKRRVAVSAASPRRAPSSFSLIELRNCNLTQPRGDRRT
ncbi:uncharacterized protein LOC131197786 isoform X2 [Ahaetulla prasina]|uniref:uncharacterized protein LOC131197786 isoform X2 n=1 Tax=Ahaetulla prasina TaxID=499056 RepID=UPI00264A2FEA|nr:uncharacterized protein LOC131197786 isoform X2 [Ahaetulla prasina]